MSTPWTATHVETVNAARLPHERGGYNTEDVDRQIARMAVLMRQQRPVPHISVLSLRRSRLRDGYAPAAVEALFAHVVSWQQDFDHAAPPPNPTPIAKPGSGARVGTSEASDRAGAQREWTHTQQDWVREVRFARRTGTRAYDEGDVDGFLNRVLTAMAKGDELPPIQSVRFYPPKRARGGYDAIAVDVFLDQLGTIRPILH